MTTEYSIPKSATMSDIKNRVHDIFSRAISFKSTQGDILKDIEARIYKPLGVRYANGRRKHSVYMAGYAQGVIDGYRDQLFQNHLEFCYLVDGELYTTHHPEHTTRKTTKPFYEAGIAHEKLKDAPNGYYWKNSDKPYFI